MALFRHCLSKATKPHFVTFSVTAIADNSLWLRPKHLGSKQSAFHGMSTWNSPSGSLLLGRVGSQRDDRGDEKGRKGNFPFSIMFVPAIFKGFFNSDTQQELTPEDKLVNHIKRSILLMQNGESEKAERLLHITLKMAQDLKHEKGITYVYDTMANLAFENGQFAKAQKLFVEVLRRLIGGGLPHDDIIVINISLKVADCFIGLGDYQKGEEGFLFCIDSLKKKISSGASDEDTLVLYSQSLDRYSLFLVQVNRSDEAVKHITTAVEVAESVFGDLNNKVGAILLSDMGVVKTAAGDKEEAANCFEKALQIAAKEENDASVAVIMVNRGVALKDSGILKEGNHWCELALTQAIKERNKAIKNAAEECLKANNNANEEIKKKRVTHTAI